VLRIRYRLPQLGSGDITLGWGNSIELGNAGTLHAALGLRWNPTEESFTERPDERTGALVVSTGLEREGERLSYELAAGAAYTNPNTTGVRRLLGMEEAVLSVPLVEETAALASTPVGATGSRGRLLYKDYRDHTLLQGAVLRSFAEPDWPPAEQIFAYDDFTATPPAGKGGPYTVAGSSASDQLGQSLALDFELDALGDWVSVHLPPLPGAGTTDLSATTAVVVSYRPIAATSGVQFAIELGALAEDLDGDRKLDAETTTASTASTGFVFDDSDNGALLLVGGGPQSAGNDRLDTEDVNGNGSLDAESTPSRRQSH
jgi:hypothetical protein